MQATAASQTAAPRFGGVRGTVRGRHWLSPEAFQQLLNLHPTPYVGKLPRPIVAALAGNPPAVYPALDQVSALLRGVREPLTLELTIDGQPARLETLGKGDFGTVYRLSINGHDYALKIFHDPDEQQHLNGSYPELNASLHFSRKTYRDLAHFHFGNPEAGWGVYELIEKDMFAQGRPGPSIHTEPVQIRDVGGKNSVNGVRVDTGEFHKYDADAEALLKAPHGMSEYRRWMAHDRTAVQVAVASWIRELPEAERQEAFELALATGKPAVVARAAVYLYSLPPEKQMAAYRAVMAQDGLEAKAVAARQINRLSDQLPADGKNPLPAPSLQWEAFRRAMAVPDAKTRIAALYCLSNLPPAHRQAAFDLAMATGDDAVRAMAVDKLDGVFLEPEKALAAYFDWIDAPPEAAMPSVRAAAVLGAFRAKPPKTGRDRLFEQAIQSPHAELRLAVAKALLYIPTDEKENALRALMDTGDAAVQHEVLAHLTSVALSNPGPVCWEVVRSALESPDPSVRRHAIDRFNRLSAADCNEAVAMVQALDEPALYQAALGSASFPREAMPAMLSGLARHAREFEQGPLRALRLTARGD